MITFNKSDFDTILEYAKKNLPEEACGLIGGTIENGDKHIKKIYLLTNIDHSNEHFSMDPKEQLAAVKDMRANGLGDQRTDGDQAPAHQPRTIVSLMRTQNPALDRGSSEQMHLYMFSTIRLPWQIVAEIRRISLFGPIERQNIQRIILLP